MYSLNRTFGKQLSYFINSYFNKARNITNPHLAKVGMELYTKIFTFISFLSINLWAENPIIIIPQPLVRYIN